MPLVSWSELPDDSRFWCFVSSRPITPDEESLLHKGLEKLCQDWAAHGVPVHAGFSLVEGRLLAIAADEGRTAASGCSIDNRMAALRAIGDPLGIDWLGRMHVYADQGSGWERLRLQEARQLQGGRFLDSVAQTKGTWRPIKNLVGSWLQAK